MHLAERRDRFFAAGWSDFVRIAPKAAALRAAFERAGETVVNDHVALRTFNLGPISLRVLEPRIIELGYRQLDEYHFEQKCLRARAYVCDGAPRIFLSELLVERFDDTVRSTIEACVGQVHNAAARTENVFWGGRLWQPIRSDQYRALYDVSEYAAWVCALGLRPNHFTVSINALKNFDSVESVLQFAEQNGHVINESGGRVKGSRDQLLEQGSTMAEHVEVAFADSVQTIPSCYYEFALRHPLPDGTLYQGFVPQSADKIFESTHR